MTEKRKFQRYACKFKAKFSYFEGDPDNIDIRTAKAVKCKGSILDISRGGIFISTNFSAGINRPVIVNFKTSRRTYSRLGSIVRTGLIDNNPAEVLHKFKDIKIRENSYIAVEFDQPIDDFREDDIELI